ncbi:TetR/AcrR family transcriptional regulator [Propionimicrobium sp. PCR01-08-3]|uniref:TetR/AcrR family transcriptional regulator n=1 Tax=Propionimicrobium sp. PCR01-08-3 TaxID=3052086 RepID=UPI00255C36B0|nr:TetR/AcrR family transcriptional regulator [Propionimicrobium sp. PCR01-08-3]WIY82569.1 TetR/AcrR family transcriptional regulator [Propionimicrobium sp. PCR01-08-3]
MAAESKSATKPRKGTRGLDREMVIQAALQSIDLQGAQGLTMRGLGKELGVEAMSLYHYATGREDVLEGVVALLLQDVPKQLSGELCQSWQGYLQALAHAIRKVAVEHPLAFPLVATRHPAAPWLRPPLRSLEIVEHFLGTLEGFAFSEDQTARTYRSFSSFLLGHLLLEATMRGAETSPIEEPLDEGEATVPNGDGDLVLPPDSPLLRFRSKLSEDHEAEEFEAALETLLERIEMEISQ